MKSKKKPTTNWTNVSVAIATGLASVVVAYIASTQNTSEIKAANYSGVQINQQIAAAQPPASTMQPSTPSPLDAQPLIRVQDGAKFALDLESNSAVLAPNRSLTSTPPGVSVRARNMAIQTIGPGTVYEVRSAQKP